jgi:hypothetical protein
MQDGESNSEGEYCQKEYYRIDPLLMRTIVSEGIGNYMIDYLFHCGIEEGRDKCGGEPVVEKAYLYDHLIGVVHLFPPS